MDFDDVVYKRRIIDMLNTIVMTTSELHSLRIRLKDMKTEVRYSACVQLTCHSCRNVWWF